MKADVILGLVFGDEGKGKITAHRAKHGDYTHCLRYNGGSNAGHTIYLDGKKAVTHIVPTGALFGLKSIVGPGCVVNENEFFRELEELSKVKPDVYRYVHIANNAHIVQDKHIQEELEESKIGTTRKGIGPAYRDKHARIGIRAESIPSLKNYLIDVEEEFISDPIVLCEGAQALGLDIDWGAYPYVTSSSCGIGAVINSGVPHKTLRKITGVAKCYDTYVGANTFQDLKDPMLDLLGDVGNEVGATTGRRRQVNYLNLDNLYRAVRYACVDEVILNKIDVLEEVNCWKVIVGNGVVDCFNRKGFEAITKMNIRRRDSDIDVIFSESPHEI